jgi:DNA-binding NtrC family response regulator
MTNIMVAWLGITDLKAAEGDKKAGMGPIGQAVRERGFDRVELISNFTPAQEGAYRAWLGALRPARGRRAPEVGVHRAQLSRPTAYGEIYERAVGVLELLRKRHPDASLFYHLSPGTPAMAAMWLLLAKTRFPATLIESSPQQGVQDVEVPFDIAVDFLPELLRGPDEELVRLTQALPPEAPAFDQIVHRSAVMRRVVARARLVAPRRIPVLIQGESGTGKELLARAIHGASPRRERAFVAVNCGAIPEALVESELFGHEKGAFTGAGAARGGTFEAADGGTLFLDEIGELPRTAQVKLLRVLQDGQVQRVGSTQPRPVDVRLISATNRDLLEEMRAGRFREDLFHRLAVAVLVLPPLRERGEDVSLLLDTLLDQVNRESESEPGYEHKRISVAARNLLRQHPWPGNVRELLNTLRRAAVWSRDPLIDVREAREALLPLGAPAGPEPGVLGRPLGAELSLPDLMAEVARHYLARAMDEANGNKTRAAGLIGLPNYQTLTNWLKKYGV